MYFLLHCLVNFYCGYYYTYIISAEENSYKFSSKYQVKDSVLLIKNDVKFLLFFVNYSSKILNVGFFNNEPPLTYTHNLLNIKIYSILCITVWKKFEKYC